AFIDGGMTDNIRPALYQAEYEAALPNKINEPIKETYTIAGKACESGDVVINKIDLPQVETGDLLLVNGTGSDNYFMESKYKHIPIEDIVQIDDEKSYLTIKR